MLTRTCATAGPGKAAEVTVPPPVAVAEVSGAPTHTGRFPARPEPADGPACNRDARCRAAVVAMTAVPLPAAGHDVCGRVHGRMAGTATLWPWTGWTATGLPADAAGARPQPPNTCTAASTPATRDSTATIEAATSG